MVDNQLAFVEPRDPSAWSKTAEERRQLRRFKHLYKGEFRCSSSPAKHSILRDKLIIYLKKNKKFPKTTYSTTCWSDEIDLILGNFVETKDAQTVHLVSKYVFNGKTYKFGEKPFICL